MVEKLPTETVPETLVPTEASEKEPVKVHGSGKGFAGSFEDLGCLSGPFFNLFFVVAFLKPIILCGIKMVSVPCLRGKQEKQARKPWRNHAGVFTDACECTIQQGKAVEGGEIPRSKWKSG